MRWTILFCAVTVTVTAAAAAELPKAETLMEKYVEATGGRANYEKRKSDYMSGSVEMPAQGIKGKLEIWAEAPNSQVEVMEIDGIGKMETGTNGSIAWENSAVMGPRLRAGEELRYHLREATFNAPLYWKKLYKKVETVGVEAVDGADCYKIVLTPPEGKPETWFMEQKTWLILKIVRTSMTTMGEIAGEYLFKDYTDSNGILLPTTLIQKAAGAEIRMKVEVITPNMKIPRERFAPPAEVQQLLHKKAA